jgi:hypothetical protein
MTSNFRSDADRALYSVREFCRRNSIGKTTFFALVRAGAVVTVKVGTRTLVPASSEQAWHDTLAGPTHKPTHKSTADVREPERTAAGHKSRQGIDVKA